jgi:hypothetical protein
MLDCVEPLRATPAARECEDADYHGSFRSLPAV